MNPYSALADDSDEQAHRAAAANASLALERASRAAGLNLSALPSMSRTGQVDISSVSPQVASELATLIRRRAKSAFRAAAQLKAAFQSHDLEIPDPHVSNRQICLGDVTLETADRLACLLGAPPQRGSEGELAYWPHTQMLVARLSTAFRQATGGGFLDPEHHPACLRCNTEAHITLGAISPELARRMAGALRAAEGAA
ncbi:hypothetical protein AB0H82_26170 [Streptomyces sp. NPDC050732]|uniref:hypothetical protein n=1 Tax=Streptomyces sp. NPDC050732 TaxID=3154632 RepID=UPI003442D654